MNFLDIVPRRGERAFIVGMTGCGKSVLVYYLSLTRKSVLVFDAKNEIKWKGYQRFSRLDRLISAQPLRAIYAPRIEELDNPAYHERFFKYGYLRKRTTIIGDEILAFSDNNELPRWAKATITRGRSLEVEFWGLVQRPVSIPQWFISEAENKYIFYLDMPQDREKVRKIIGVSEDEQATLRLENHDFFYRRVSRRTILKTRLIGVK